MARRGASPVFADTVLQFDLQGTRGMHGGLRAQSVCGPDLAEPFPPL